MGENNFNTSKIAKELLQLKSKIVTAQVTIWAKSLNRNFFKQEIQTAYGFIIKCSTSLVRER
jgi:hypothetical protein